MRLRGEILAFLSLPLTSVLLFWNTLAAIIVGSIGLLYYLHVKGVFRIFRKLILRSGRKAEKKENIASAAESEPTLITTVLQAPYQLLGISQDAGTSTIFCNFHQKLKEQQNPDLRLNKNGRRLTAAKNNMLSQRRRKQGAPSQKSTAKSAVNQSLGEFLKGQPVYYGKVIQFKNLSPALLASYQVGKEIAEIGTTTTIGMKEVYGKGNSRFVVYSQNGRLLTSSTNEGQVVFLPGTRFVILSRTPWRNPDSPQEEGYTFELAEVA